MRKFATRSLAWAALYGGIFALTTVMAADPATGHFSIGDSRLDVRHAIAVIHDPSGHPEQRQTLIYLSAQPLDAAQVAAAFDADDGVRAQEPAGGYIRLCLDWTGEDCGLFYSPEGFNSGGYGELVLERHDANRVVGRFHLDQPEDFFGKTYEFDLRFDAPVTPAPGSELPGGGGEPGKAYQEYLDALARGDLSTLRGMAGEEGRWRYPDDDATAAKEALKSARDGQPVQATIARGRQHGDQAVLWVSGTDRDDIRRAGRVLMHKGPQGWVYAESDLDSVEEE